MNYQTIAAVVVSLLVFLPFLFADSPSVATVLPAVVCIVALPYAVECMVAGGCALYAWAVVVALSLGIGYAFLIKIPGDVRRSEESTAERRRIEERGM